MKMFSYWYEGLNFKQSTTLRFRNMKNQRFDHNFQSFNQNYKSMFKSVFFLKNI